MSHDRRSKGPRTTDQRRGQRIKRERLGTRLSAVYFFRGKCRPKTTCKEVGRGSEFAFSGGVPTCTSVCLCIPGNVRRSINNKKTK